MRNLLHKTKLNEFKAWLDSEGVEHRPGRGDYQVLQVCIDRKHWLGVYERNVMLEHYSTDRRLDPIVRRYCRQRENHRVKRIDS